MIILLTVIAFAITGVPLAAVLLVTVASKREESARSIAGHAPGSLERAARRLLAFHATGISRPAYRAGARDRRRGRPGRRPAAGPALSAPPAPDDGLALAGGAWPQP